MPTWRFVSIRGRARRLLSARSLVGHISGASAATGDWKLEEGCGTMVDGLCGREPPCRSDYSATWSLEEWLQLLDFLTGLFSLAVGSNVPDEEVGKTGQTAVFCPSAQIVTSCLAGSVQVLAKLSDVDHSHAEAVRSVLRARQEEIRRALLTRTNSISSAILQDFDWQLKVSQPSVFGVSRHSLMC
ncbi:hypothetical protein GOODEAATRI_031110 [Goodea atripinnis]|uniref:COMMD8 helical N-terminal domain-containing protein n=1 Tax=Goodea atripinnis TaxID=208336 RepID=A0ABV0Q2J0_9TELE